MLLPMKHQLLTIDAVTE